MEIISKTFNVYSFSELSESAKQTAIENIESNDCQYLECGKQYF